MIGNRKAADLDPGASPAGGPAPGRRRVLMALIALGLLPPVLRPSMLPGGLPGASGGAAGRGVHLVGGWILSDHDLARLRR